MTAQADQQPHSQKPEDRETEIGAPAPGIYRPGALFFGLADSQRDGYRSGVIGWIGDFFRLWWGLVYWNVRKSLFRLRRSRARCPCQNPSDSGRGGETGCDAAQVWHHPARFQRVCPLLIATPQGLRCSADARDVRPFWGRAAAWYAGGLAALYLALTLAAFGGLRLIGYRISPLATVWPADWSELRLARSELFTAKARQALAEHNVSEAILSLEVAFHSNPANYVAGLQLAQLMSVGQPDTAEKLFALLMRLHPKKRPTTALAWLRLLLEQGRFDHAAGLAAQMLLDDPAQRPAWLHALFQTTRFAHDDQPLRSLIDRHAGKLPSIDVALINSELLIRQGKGLTLLPGLTTALPASAGSFGPYYQVSRLLELGRPSEAKAMLDHYTAAGRIGDVDAYRLELGLLAATGRDDLLRRRLDGRTLNARELQIVCEDLVRHPDRNVLEALDRCLQRSHLPSDAATYSATTAYLVACGVVGDEASMKAAGARLEELSGKRMARLDAVEAFFRRRDSNRKISRILPSLPALSVDMIYALYDAYPPPVSPKAVSRP